MEQVQERVIRIVRKLLDRTVERGCTPDEAAGAAAKARELLDRHQLSMLDIKSGKLNEEMAQEKVSTGRARANLGESVLACAIGEGCGCRVFHTNLPSYTIHFLGFKSDAQVARYLYSTILDALIARANRDAIWARVSGPKLTQWRKNFLLGAAGGIRKRLKQMHEVENQPSTEEGEPAPITKEQRYALVSVKQPEVEKFVRTVFPNPGKAATVKSNNAAAYEKGRIAGREVAIRKGVEGVPTKLIGG